MNKNKARVNSIETFGSVDGPGVRFVVFLKGCPMRCKYCHNPETWTGQGQLITVEELCEKVMKYRAYWGKDMKNGGVTVSGGEPLLQIDFLIEFFRALKVEGVHTALDTSGQPFVMDKEYLVKFDTLLDYTDLVLLDIKHTDSMMHNEITGCGNENILELARYLSDKKIPVWIRRVLVPGLTDDEAELTNLKKFIDSLSNVEKVEILPYHTMGVSKWSNLGLDYPLKGISVPGEEQICRAKKILGI